MAGWADSAWSPLQLNTTNWGQNTSHPRCYSTISTQGLVDLVRRRSMRCGVVVGSNITIAVMTDCDGGGRDRLESERSLSPRTPVTLRTDGRTPPRHCFLSVPLRDPPPPSPHLTSLLNVCLAPLGHRMLRGILLWPQLTISILSARPAPSYNWSS